MPHWWGAAPIPGGTLYYLVPGTFENEAVELYHLEDDSGEHVDLEEKSLDRAGAMLKQLKARYADAQRTAAPQPGGGLSDPH